jgi:hypothetical protein
VLTVAIVLVMQVQVGERTIESHALSFVQSSAVITPLNRVARGAAQLIQDLRHKLAAKTDHYRRELSGDN